MSANALAFAGTVESSTRQKGAEVLAKVLGGNRITHVWGFDPNAGNPEHHSGLALDFMTFDDKALGDRVFDYLWRHRVRLGVKHIIWQQAITSTVTSPGVRRPMPDRGSPTANHRDHVHVLFLATPYRQPSVDAAPSLAPRVVKARRKLIAATTITRLAVDGVLGRATISAWQRVLGTPVDGVISKPSPLVRAVQRVVGTTRDGLLGPVTWRAVQRRLGVAVDGIPGPVTIRALQRRLNGGKF